MVLSDVVPCTERPVFLVDCDGVLSDFTGAVLRALDEEFGLKFERDDVDQWSIKEALGLDDEQWHTIIKRHITAPGFASQLELLPGAKKGIERITEVADVMFVTADWGTSETWVSERNSWLQRHFGRTQGKRVIHTTHKEYVWGHVFVDDKPANVESWRQRWRRLGGEENHTAVVWDAAYNRDGDGWFDLRASNWNELAHLATALGERR